LEHHWAGLFQYAAIRRGPENALLAMEQLEGATDSVLHNVPESDQTLRPGARLYRAMRGYLAEMQHRPLSADAPEWWVPADEALAAAVIKLRRAVPPPEAEVLELFFSRGLDAEDIAFVLSISPADVESRMLAGLATAQRLLGRRYKKQEGTAERLLLQAFALDPRFARGPQRAARKPVLSLGTVVNKRYEVEAALGAGAFADVYRARDREVTDHVVALKILRRKASDDNAVRAALRELQLIASVFHPSVVQLKDHGWHEGHLWFVMPLYRGETLANRLRGGPLDRKEAREIFEALAEALATMHRAGVRHQDVKPENVFLANIDPEGGQQNKRVLPVLLDLGVAAKDAELVLAGTPAYFAPEVAARFSGVPDPPPVGPKADVFSLALTLRQALDPTPRDYVAAGAVDAFVSFRATHGPQPPWRRDLRDLRPSFERWLNVSPDARPSGDEFRRELRVLTRPAEQRARRLGLMRWVIPAAVAVLALFGSVVHVLSREASLRRIEAAEERLQAAQARQRAASIHASLEVEEARRRELEADVARLDAQYQSSKMTREQLAARLASVEAEFALVNDRQNQRIGKQNDEARQLREQLAAVMVERNAALARRDEFARELNRTKAALDGERTRRGEADAALAALTLKLEAAEAIADDTRERVAALKSRLSRVLESAKAAAPADQGPQEPPGAP
jgi:eukaryotic-like serine/threonine-protein kinase